MNLRTMMRQKLVTVTDADTVQEAVVRMAQAHVGACAVLSGAGKLSGIFTERDLMQRVVAKNLQPVQTQVSQVMTTPVATLAPDSPAEDAMRLMSEKKIRHTLLVDPAGKLVGMISLRDLLHNKVEELDRELESVVERFTNDAPGG